MKVTLYIDGEHNTVEVKDKIKSVLPDANYMIFHPADNVSKVTEFDRIKNMSVQEMAEFIVDIKRLCTEKLLLKYGVKKDFLDTLIEGAKVKTKQWLETEVETE